MVNISYLVTCHNEDRTLANLLGQLSRFAGDRDEIVILDDFSDNPKTQQILSDYSKKDNVRLYQHALDKNYGGHKNAGIALCKSEWIFQIDGDELPSETLLLNIKAIIEENPDTELFVIPRINNFRGVTPEHAKMWGWRLTPCLFCQNRPIVNWPDYQGRLHKNIPDRIKWDRRLHEKLEGFKKFTSLPADEELALYHDKTIEVQLATNKRYNEWFTQAENRGHGGFNR